MHRIARSAPGGPGPGCAAVTFWLCCAGLLYPGVPSSSLTALSSGIPLRLVLCSTLRVVTLKCANVRDVYLFVAWSFYCLDACVVIRNRTKDQIEGVGGCVHVPFWRFECFVRRFLARILI
jgi:hypothetical protein